MRSPDGQLFGFPPKRTEPNGKPPIPGSPTKMEGDIRQSHRILMSLEDRLVLHRKTTNSTQVHAQIERQRKHLEDLLCQYWSQVKMIQWPLPSDIRAMLQEFDLASKESGCGTD